jgi:hypothetical protein
MFKEKVLSSTESPSAEDLKIFERQIGRLLKAIRKSDDISIFKLNENKILSPINLGPGKIYQALLQEYINIYRDQTEASKRAGKLREAQKIVMKNSDAISYPTKVLDEYRSLLHNDMVKLFNDIGIETASELDNTIKSIEENIIELDSFRWNLHRIIERYANKHFGKDAMVVDDELTGIISEQK